MTSVDEDLLLNGDGEDFENVTVFDEEALLNGDINRKSPFDEPKVEQDDDEKLCQSSTTIDDSSLPEKENSNDLELREEELDYDDDEDEDEEKRERSNRFASEKRNDDGLSEEPEDDDSKPKIPSLFEKDITCPFKDGKQIAVKLRFEGETQERIFLPKPQFMGSSVAPIVPRLPNGIPLIPTGPTMLNHGSAGFGPTYLEKLEVQRAAGGMGMAASHIIPNNVGHWDQAVDMFLNGGRRKRNSRHSTSKRSRRDRSSSSDRSYSSYSSYSSRSRSRSRSYSPKRRRRDSDRDRRDRKRSRKDNEKDRRDRKKVSYEDKKRKEKHATIESAQALGLSNEYLDKVKEQKRRRDEMIRLKEERRHGTTSNENKKPSTLSQPQPSTSNTTSTSAVANDRDKKLKAYLVVNISGLKQLPTSVKKVEQLANELGQIKKCWKSTDDVVSVIFNAHDKAKDFMIKYNNKVITGLRIAVSLEKKWLNISEMC